MQKSPLIGISIIAVILLVLGSLTNVVGYQTLQSSNQKVINDEVDQKELLFQLILDLANNKEIQKITFTYEEVMGKGFFNPSSSFSVFTPSLLTKKFLNTAYHIGLILSKTISKSKIHLMLERYQGSNQDVQRKITTVIEKNITLTTKINELSDVQCDCKKNNTTDWNFPVLCLILLPIALSVGILWYIIGIILRLPIPHFLQVLFDIIKNIATTLNCWTIGKST